jgi:hypothetical protein
MFFSKIVEEFKERLIEERNKNRQLGVFIKQDFTQKRKEEIKKLREELEKVRESCLRKVKKMKDYEVRQLKYIHSLSSLDRFIEEERKKRKDMEKEVQSKN